MIWRVQSFFFNCTRHLDPWYGICLFRTLDWDCYTVNHKILICPCFDNFNSCQCETPLNLLLLCSDWDVSLWTPYWNLLCTLRNALEVLWQHFSYLVTIPNFCLLKSGRNLSSLLFHEQQFQYCIMPITPRLPYPVDPHRRQWSFSPSQLALQLIHLRHLAEIKLQLFHSQIHPWDVFS